MSLAPFRIINNEFWNKDPDIFPEVGPIIILDRKSSVCMDKYGKDTKHKRQIYRRVHFVSNDERLKMHHIE